MTCVKPISHLTNRLPLHAIVDSDVLARNIRQRRSIPICATVENEGDLLLLPIGTEALCREEHSKLERHIETRQLRFEINGRERNIVNA